VASVIKRFRRYALCACRWRCAALLAGAVLNKGAEGKGGKRWPFCSFSRGGWRRRVAGAAAAAPFYAALHGRERGRTTA